jgi:hypothetical protein
MELTMIVPQGRHTLQNCGSSTQAVCGVNFNKINYVKHVQNAILGGYLTEFGFQVVHLWIYK